MKSFRIKGTIWIGVWLGFTLLALPFDRMVYGWVRVRPHGVVRDVLTALDYMAGYPIHLLILSILVSARNRKRLIGGYAVTMIAQGIVSNLIKILVGRARPPLAEGPFHFLPLTLATGMTSFPSGDATAGMALATLLGIYFPRSRWLFWTLGLAAGLARVVRGRHFLSDVIFGAGLGYACVLLSVRWLGPRYFFQYEMQPGTSAPVYDRKEAWEPLPPSEALP